MLLLIRLDGCVDVSGIFRETVFIQDVWSLGSQKQALYFSVGVKNRRTGFDFPLQEDHPTVGKLNLGNGRYTLLCSAGLNFA